MTPAPLSPPRNDLAGVTWLARAGGYLFPWRIVVGMAALPAGLMIVHPRNLFGPFSTAGAIGSGALVALGLMLRAWAAASAGGHTRTAEIEAPQLVTGGPYAHVRNPIYLGSFVLGLGMIGLLGDPWLLVPHLAVFYVFFGMIVPAEERFLQRQFGNEFLRFRRAVPKFIPTLRPWSARTERGVLWSAARGELWIALLLAVIYGVFRFVLMRLQVSL